jgi:hypothetical protein
MTIIIKELENEPIIIIDLKLPHEPEVDVKASQEAATAFKKKRNQHIYRIIDMSFFNLSFTEAMMGMAADMNAEGGVNDKDISTIYVGSSDMVKMGATAVQQQSQYGATNVVCICSTVDEGIAFARADLQKKKE